MKNFKKSPDLWLVAGVCFTLAFIINLLNNKSSISSTLSGITSILCFLNAYINHKKY